MSARRKQLIALSVVLVCVIGMAAYGIVRVSNKTADKENGFDVAMTDTTDKSEDEELADELLLFFRVDFFASFFVRSNVGRVSSFLSSSLTESSFFASLF